MRIHGHSTWENDSLPRQHRTYPKKTGWTGGKLVYCKKAEFALLKGNARKQSCTLLFWRNACNGLFQYQLEYPFLALISFFLASGDSVSRLFVHNNFALEWSQLLIRHGSGKTLGTRYALWGWKPSEKNTVEVQMRSCIECWWLYCMEDGRGNQGRLYL